MKPHKVNNLYFGIHVQPWEKTVAILGYIVMATLLNLGMLPTDDEEFPSLRKATP